MATTLPKTGPWSVVLEAEPIRIWSSGPEPDESWVYTDAAGHEHRYDNGYPTLVSVKRGAYWCVDCRDEHTLTHLECPLCGEWVSPGTRPASPFPKTIPGMRSARVLYNGRDERREYVATTEDAIDRLSTYAQSVLDALDRGEDVDGVLMVSREIGWQ